MPTSVASALATWLAAITPLPAERLAAAEALGRTLVDDVVAPGDLPAFARSMMDGYAVRRAWAGQEVALAAARHAGDDASLALPLDQAMPIMTGAVVPQGAEAVVPKELVERTASGVRLPAVIAARANIVDIGAEARRGATVLRAGTMIGPLALAALIALDVPTVLVRRRPQVAIRTTGSELCAAGPLALGAIRDSNGPMLAAMFSELGQVAERSSIGDDADALAALIRGNSAELLVLTGGVSAGDKDHVPAVLRDLGAEVLVQGVDQKPGKPLLLARLDGRLVAALPGNPLAVHWCCTAFLAPALRALAGLPTIARRVRVDLGAALPGSKERPWFVPCAITADGRAQPLLPASSADVVGPATISGYASVAAGAAPLPAGAPIDLLLCGAAAWTCA